MITFYEGRKIKEQRTKNDKQRAKSNEQLAESNEHQAKSNEQRVRSNKQREKKATRNEQKSSALAHSTYVNCTSDKENSKASVSFWFSMEINNLQEQVFG